MKTFRLGDLELHFGSQGKWELPTEEIDRTSPAGPPETHLINEAPATDLLLPSEKEEIEGFVEAQKLLEDPHHYEQSLIDEDLDKLRRGDIAEHNEATDDWGSE